MANKEQIFVLTYEDINGEEQEMKVMAKSHVNACELAESEDPDLGQIFSVCTEREHEARKNQPENHKQKYRTNNFLSI